ncbi:hypothetical protein CONCODRAFT_79588 [Conidiobolus coronatus NRRL 28638]|uniref:Pentacotripeptide-repeat region of PRORP domain-containing protein n=1 Tax=Conidiobolus coronatus (strain ATCC 28846 / CBS 209.66 / NRRL 28638) TaxID=796925 RepID=A0A137P1N1_CONC2|nr:hypothetical protein CONCODRAFT_79588 [Conidiobolus coronatus NRRL 28638]|eukprot:KXN68922.1 hypothetical protein CONCODRAFT_79588 [Conidiobolus coronatus NRRL 28638]
MRYSSIYANNPLLNNISKLDKIESNWRLYSNFKRIGYKVDLPLHMYVISQICSNPDSSWEFLKVSINNLKSCEEFRNGKLRLPTRLVNFWIKYLIDAERFDSVSLLLDELKPEFNYKTYQLLIYAQSGYNQTLFPHFDMLSILQKSINLNIKLSPPLAARILSYLHNQNHHTELLNWLEVIRDQKIRIPKVTLNKIISELGASEYYSVILRIWEILSKHPDAFNNHIITTILNAFSKANLEQTDLILTNIIDILKRQNIPLSTSIFNVLMKHSNLKNQPHLTDLYFQLIQENSLKLSAYSYNLMLQKSYKLNDLPTIEGIYELVQTNWFKPNELTYLWLLDIYTELANWDRVREILDLIPLKLINNNLKLQKKVELAKKKLEGENDEYN